MEGKYINLDERLIEQTRNRKEKPFGLIELIVEPDPNEENGGTYKILPINPRNRSKQGEYRLLPMPTVEPDSNPNKNITKGYIHIPGWEGYIPIELPIRVPEEEIEKYIGIVPVKDPKSRCKPEGVYWLPVLEPDCSRPGEYVLVPGVGYVWMPSLKPKFDEIKS